MLYAFISLAVVLVVVVVFLLITTVRKKKKNPNKELLKELDELKNKGLINEQEYNEKRTEILNRGGKNE